LTKSEEKSQERSLKETSDLWRNNSDVKICLRRKICERSEELNDKKWNRDLDKLIIY
jgi:hypothetical protein